MYKFKEISTPPCTAFELFQYISSDEHPFILDSATNHEKLGRYSFVGSDPFLILKTQSGLTTLANKDSLLWQKNSDPFVELQKLLEVYAFKALEPLPFCGGAVGYIGYDNFTYLENITQHTVDDLLIPDLFFGFYDQIYMFDHQKNSLTLIALDLENKATTKLLDMQQRIYKVPRVPELQPFDLTNLQTIQREFKSNMSKDEYLAAIDKIKAYILAGDIYQANFTQRFECDYHDSPINLYRNLRTINPAPFSAYIDTGESIILSSSPERFLRINQDEIETRPIKGTRKRGLDVVEDLNLKQELLQSEKDRAELLMIVDLERNDLGKIAQPKTVTVDELFTVETYATVHHLIGNIKAKIAPQYSLIDCLQATFPGGSITGAPKIRAMEIIEELEPTKRKVYTGSIGYIGFNNSLDLNIAIRTIIIADKKAFFQVGGGIVWDSEPEAEFQESLTKAKALKVALNL